MSDVENRPDDIGHCSTSDGSASDDTVKAALSRLAGPDCHAVIQRADAAVDDLNAAAEFVESEGLDKLAAAIQATDDPELRRRGERALEAFDRFRIAAAGSDADVHFHRGRGTDLRRDIEESIE